MKDFFKGYFPFFFRALTLYLKKFELRKGY